jgi:glutamate--cysteine ligase
MNFSSYFKPSDKLLIGLECEAFLFREKRLSFEEIVPIFGWFISNLNFNPVYENQFLIGAKSDCGEISIEPGGQFEFATPPFDSLEQLSVSLSWYHENLTKASKQIGFEVVFKGYDDISTDVPWMPKKRYEIMKKYMEKNGSLGLEMMQKTCTTQINLDYLNEADMVKKLRKATKLNDCAAENFSTSAHKGFSCYRKHIWQNTDPARTGPLSFVFDDDMGFEKYTKHVLDVPLYFIKRDHGYIDQDGKKLLEIDYTWQDWVLHTNTVFFDIRLNPQIELRVADSGSFEHQMALAKFWVENLYG